MAHRSVGHPVGSIPHLEIKALASSGWPAFAGHDTIIFQPRAEQNQVCYRSRRLRGGSPQRDKAGHIRCILRPMRQGLDMAHRRAIEEEKGPAVLPVIAPHFGGTILAHKSGFAECRLQIRGRHVEILAGLATRRRGRNGGRRWDRRRRRRLGGTARGQQGQDQTRKTAHHISLLHQSCLALKCEMLA
jgi:hypothetical protein